MLKLRFVLLLLFCSYQSFAQLELPKAPEQYQPIIDKADLLSAAAEAKLGERLRAYERKSGNQFVVLTLPSLNGQAIEQVSAQIAESWGIGQQGSDNGLLLLVAKAERKVRIEVGYGLEASIPDLKVKDIIENQILPSFKTGDYDKGVAAGVQSLIKVAQGDFERKRTLPTVPMWLLVVLAVLGLSRIAEAAVPLFRSKRKQAFQRSVARFLIGVILLLGAVFYAWFQYKGEWLDWWLGLLLIGMALLLIWGADFLRNQRAQRLWREELSQIWRKVENWAATQERYQSEDVQVKLMALRERLFAPQESEKAREEVLVKARSIFLIPQTYFEPRNDYALRQMEEPLQQQLAQWAEVHADWMQLSWERALAQWEPLSSASLSTKQKNNLAADEAFFKEKISHPFTKSYQTAWSYLQREDKLEELLDRYYPAEKIRKEWNKLRDWFLRPETVEIQTDLDAVVDEVQAVLEHPAEHFTERNDYVLRQWTENDRIQRLLETKWYRADRRAALRGQLETARTYFSALSSEALDEEDQAALNEILATCQQLHDNPKAVLGYDRAFLKEEIDYFWKDRRWKNLEGAYTAQSIRQKRKELEYLQEQVENTEGDTQTAALFELYSTFVGLFSNPDAYLDKVMVVKRVSKPSIQKKKPQKKQKQVTREGSSFWTRHSCSKKKEEESASSSSWGGGSFGGGGATGSW